LRHQPDCIPELPPVEELKERARAVIARADFADPAFGRQLNQLMPKIEVFPYRLIDGGAVVLRARLTITLAPLLGTAAELVGPMLTRTVMVDLFDPPQRAAVRERLVAMRAAAEALEITVTAANRSLSLHRKMAAAGLSDPYRLVKSSPDGECKLRRHKHLRYEFRPRAGYPAWPDAAEVAAA
jgi:hypothetical protein